MNPNDTTAAPATLPRPAPAYMGKDGSGAPCAYIVKRYRYRKPQGCGVTPTTVREVSNGKRIQRGPLCAAHAAEHALPVRKAS